MALGIQKLFSNTGPYADKNNDYGDNATMTVEAITHEPLNEALRLRLTGREKARLKSDADLAGLNLSELVRRRYFGRPIVAHADAIVIKELRRLAGVLKQWPIESRQIYSQEIVDTLVEVKRYLERLSRDC